MSLRSRASVSLRLSRTPWRCSVASITLLLIACSPGSSLSSAPSPPMLDLTASSMGVCAAIVALPDLPAAKRAFTNLAHDALHGLVADPRLDRTTSARVLETMGKVEADFYSPSDVTELTADLAALHSSADAALHALGVEAPPCAE
jgi:hypothetical protein